RAAGDAATAEGDHRRTEVRYPAYVWTQTASLFDHLVGAGEQRWRHREAQCLKVDAISYLVGVCTGKSAASRPSRCDRHSLPPGGTDRRDRVHRDQTSGPDEVTPVIDRGQLVAGCCRDDRIAMH